jgi:phosphoheptose isomerase
MASTIQEEIKARLFSDSFGEHVAVLVYQAMRFEREDETPDWEICGNSHAQQEARAVSARLVERFRLELRDLPDTSDVCEVDG